MPPGLPLASRAVSRFVAALQYLADMFIATHGEIPSPRPGKIIPWSWISQICKNLGTAESRQRHRRRDSFAGSFQMFAAEATDYSKKSLESRKYAAPNPGKAAFRFRATMPSRLTRVHGVSCEMAHLVKMSGLYCNLFKRSSRPIQKSGGQDAPTQVPWRRSPASGEDLDTRSSQTRC